MRYVTFGSRGETMNFLYRLKKAGVPATTAPTPVMRGEVCALSVKFDDRFTLQVKQQLLQGNYRTLKGIF